VSEFHLCVRWTQMLRTYESVSVEADTRQEAIDLLQLAINEPYESNGDDLGSYAGNGITLSANGRLLFIERPNNICEEAIEIEIESRDPGTGLNKQTQGPGVAARGIGHATQHDPTVNGQEGR
jgi:hypothetical protein